jgi:hypothetical protein
LGITLSVCTLSKKREAMLREDPSLVWELSSAVPGYFSLEKAWDALRLAVKPFDPSEIVAKLFGGELGKSFGEPGAFSKPRIVSNEELSRVARAMTEIPPRFVRDRSETLRGKSVHGAYFDEPDDDDLEQLEQTFEQVRDLISLAAKRGDGLLLVFR